MDITITPEKLKGTLQAIASKSYAHRIIIAAALCNAPTKINLNTTSEDIEATVSCIEALGAKIEKHDGYIIVNPIGKTNILPVLDCNESGSTARFLLPVAAALCDEFKMVGKGRLPERPHTPLINQMREKGIIIDSDTLPLYAKNKLSGGEFKISGDISSQYITGLLMALPLCDKKSKIVLTTELESKAYVDITIDVLKKFGVDVKKYENVYEINPTEYTSPKEITVEGDWSNSAFWIVLNEIFGGIEVLGLNEDSHQGDKEILNVIKEDIIDAREIPDLVPILSVLACAKKGKTKIINAKRLRIKESDRLSAITKSLSSIGAKIEEYLDGLLIDGRGELDGGEAFGFGDHRIVMSLACASCICKAPVKILGADAINKSYPMFFEDFEKLGGKVIIE